MNALLLLSGGIDSAWCLWQRVQAGLPTRTHHVVLRDHEGRHQVESRATRNVLQWIRANGGKGLVTHTESRVDFGSVNWIPKNYYLWAYWAGVLLAAPANRNINEYILPRHSDAFTGGPNSPGAKASDNAYKAIIRAIAGRTPKFQYPMVELTKAQVVASMPDDLLQRTWYCRTPRSNQPCHKCQTCLQVDPALAQRGV